MPAVGASGVIDWVPLDRSQVRLRLAIKPPSVMPGARLADSGKPPVAFVMHHTGPAGSVAGIVNDWRTHRPGIGTQYIMDREGVIYDVEKEFGYRGHGHVLPSATRKNISVKVL